jgi:hypothetical protein
MRALHFIRVMSGPVRAIHVLLAAGTVKAWMPGTRLVRRLPDLASPGAWTIAFRGVAVIASGAKQSSLSSATGLDCFVAGAPRNDDAGVGTDEASEVRQH